MAFLQPLLRAPNRSWRLEDADTGSVLARRVEGAFDSKTRRQGLLGRTGLDDTALVIAPCNLVHTFFMKFAIDVAIADREGRVVRVHHDVRPWRIAGWWRGFATVELAAGTLKRAGVAAGHRLVLRDSAH